MCNRAHESRNVRDPRHSITMHLKRMGTRRRDPPSHHNAVSNHPSSQEDDPGDTLPAGGWRARSGLAVVGNRHWHSENAEESKAEKILKMCYISISPRGRRCWYDNRTGRSPAGWDETDNCRLSSFASFAEQEQRFRKGEHESKSLVQHQLEKSNND